MSLQRTMPIDKPRAVSTTPSTAPSAPGSIYKLALFCTEQDQPNRRAIIIVDSKKKSFATVLSGLIDGYSWLQQL